MKIASWRDATLGEVVDVLDRYRVPVNADERTSRSGAVPYFGATGQVGWIDDYLFDEELILLGEDGAPFLEATKPKAYMIRGKAWVNNHAHVLRARGGVSNAFLMHQLNTIDYRNVVSGTTRLKLPQGPMTTLPLVVPPLAEQYRIVAELEKQLPRLDAAVAALERAQTNLKRYRASVLQAAVEGRLVEGGTLPFQWPRILAGGLIEWSSGKFLPKEKQSGGSIPVYGGNGITGFHNTYLIDKPTLVIGRVGALCGNVQLTSGESWITDNAIYALNYPSGSDLQFMAWVFAGAGLNEASGGSGQPFVNQKMLNAVVMPQPPLAEQRHIVAEANRRLSIVEALDTSIKVSLRRAQRLRQSVLKCAFEGRLVPQDPNDEPASVLLQRIRDERTKAGPAPAPRGGSRKGAGQMTLPEAAS